MWVSLSNKSNNVKTGPIPVSMTEEKSCPNECPLKGTDCYAKFNYLGIVWNRLSKKDFGDNWTTFCNRVKKMPLKQLWRHNQAGDLPQNKRGLIHTSKMRQLLKACKHTNGFTYTHYDPTNEHNKKILLETVGSGLTVNLSADTLTQADEYSKIGLPVVVILPSDAPDRGNKTPGGLPIVVCPAQTTDITCADCKLCQVSTRKCIVGFKAHGTAKKRLSERLAKE
jgi:hypothetical protein